MLQDENNLRNVSDWFNQRLPDGGPVYMETEPGRIIVEPWNAATSLLMLIPALFWLWKIRRDLRNSKFMAWAILLVALGGIGSALFHGFRASTAFLIMDVFPTAVLTLSMAIFFWVKVLKKWWYVFFILLPLFGLRFLFWGRLPEHASINLSYFITGISVGIPLLLLMIRSRFKEWKMIALAILSFGGALLFRQLDAYPVSFLPMGTHFLWHTLSAIGAYFILAYLYSSNSVPSKIKRFEPVTA